MTKLADDASIPGHSILEDEVEPAEGTSKTTLVKIQEEIQVEQKIL